jgi:exopolysaccharide biosynthesis polyprenyl glycosylphosphotransferase
VTESLLHRAGERAAAAGPDAASVVATRHGRREYLRRRLLAVADAVGIAVGLLVAMLAASHGHPGGRLVWALPLLPAWLVLFKLYGLYDQDGKRFSHSTLDELPSVFHALVVGGLLQWLYAKAAGIGTMTLVQGAAFVAAAFASILTVRAIVRSIARRSLGTERVLFVGDDPNVELLTRKMEAHPEHGLAPVGVVSSREGPRDPGLPVLGGISDVPRVVEEHDVERIVLSPTMLSDETQLELLRRCRELSLKISLLPHPFDALGPSVQVDDLEGLTLLGLNPPVLSRSSRAMKRSLDIAVSAAMLVLLAPLLAAVAVAIKLTSRGPVLFRQRRMGRGGCVFRVLKFRTMYEDAESRLDDLRVHSKDPNWLHLDHDPRITRVGAVLRKTSIDELPQLWNVLRGEMSLVGPRPLIESEDALIEGWARSRLNLTPGITGLWQVLGRTSIPFDEMLKLDYLYVTSWTLWGDIRLLLRTLPSVLNQRGAN